MTDFVFLGRDTTERKRFDLSLATLHAFSKVTRCRLPVAVIDQCHDCN
jgi:hypothetical protein